MAASKRDWRRYGSTAILTLLLAGWAAETPHRLYDLHDPLTLWTDAARKAPWKPRIHYNLADAKNDAFDPLGAIRELELARAMLPYAPLSIERKRKFLFDFDIELALFAKQGGYPEITSAYLNEAARNSPQLVQWIGIESPARP